MPDERGQSQECKRSGRRDARTYCIRMASEHPEILGDEDSHHPGIGPSKGRRPTLFKGPDRVDIVSESCRCLV